MKRFAVLVFLALLLAACATPAPAPPPTYTPLPTYHELWKNRQPSVWPFCCL